MDSLSKILHKTIYKPILTWYLKTDSTIRYDGFKLKIFKGVFHPKLFFSSTYFYTFLKSQDLDNTNFLEIGCGSGVLSLLAFKKGARVSAVDIDKKAVENTLLNFSLNFKDSNKAKIIQSNIFSNLPIEKFDCIAINPPYYFKKVTSDSQYAWYCGENGEYFEALFSKIESYMHNKTQCFIILEENCEIERIQTIATKYQIEFSLVDQKKIKWETSYIFKLSRIENILN